MLNHDSRHVKKSNALATFHFFIESFADKRGQCFSTRGFNSRPNARYRKSSLVLIRSSLLLNAKSPVVGGVVRVVVSVDGGAEVRVAVAVLHAAVVLDAGRLDESALPLQHQLFSRQPDEGVRFSR